MTSYYALSIALFCRLIYSIDCSVLLFFFTVYFFFQAEDGIRYSSVTGVQTCVFFFQAEDGIRDSSVTGVQTCAPDLPLATLFHAPTIAQTAAMLEKDSAPAWSSLVPIQPSGTRPPFFCVHAVGGNVLEYYDLARHRSEERRVGNERRSRWSPYH